MLGGVVKSIFGSNNERELKRLRPLVEEINSLEPRYINMSDAELTAHTPQFKERLSRGEPLDDLIPETFAVVREVGKRRLNMRHFDVQLIGGLVLHEGKIAEMKTGEGKTLVATLPIYLNALTGKGVHLVTVNDYLARRDAEWMGEIYTALGMTVGVAVHGDDSSERREAYHSDITYGQNNEFGFDYLRDNMKLEFTEKVQREYHYAIVDEVDSILVDEARTPLIISGPSEKPTETYQTANSLIKQLTDEEHYAVELKSKQVTLTEDGVAKVEEALQLENLYAPQNIDLVHHINQAIKAHATMKRDVDYVVRGGKVTIVDEFTGRLMAGRRWSDGLHQAVEAKENVEIQHENQTLATVTFQNYFRMYGKLAGMTGTADTEAVEFKKIYNLDVVIIPTNMPMLRKDHADVVFSTERGKYKAVCDDIEELVEIGQPVLVGTASIAKSEELSDLLRKRGVKHNVLNAKHHENEAFIVAQAGRKSAVTISTNMAGRGTDIVLGGNAALLAAEENVEEEERQERIGYYERTCAAERDKVLEAGGLHILGTERHESRRIDNQLRGRSGRQGDPGSSRYYVSLEDDLMKRFGGERMQSLMSRVGLGEDDAIEGPLVARAIENAQKKVEGFHFDIRKHLLDYDDVMNKQREVIYAQRAKALGGEGVEENLLEMVPDAIEEIVMGHANDKTPVKDWEVKEMFVDFREQFGVDFSGHDFEDKRQSSGKKLAQEIFDYVNKLVLERYDQRKQRFGPERMVKLERIVILQAIDHFWKEHLGHMDHLKEGIGMRAYGQKNPLHEYQREAFELFSGMLSAVRASTLQNVFIPDLPSEDELEMMEEEEREAQKRREEQAKTIHENVSEPKDADDSKDGLNRRQRRVQAARERTQKSVKLTREDYAPTAQPSLGDSQQRAKKKKKRKAARKSRKK